MSQQGRTFVALVVAVTAALAAPPAQGAEVIAVDGDRAERLVDPVVPSPAEIRLPTVGVGPLRATAARRSARGRRAVTRALRRALAARGISRARYRRYRSIHRSALSVHRRLRGARRAQLGYVLSSLEGMALRGRLISSRLRVLFIQLARNTQYWRSLPFPASGDQVTFRGSELLFQYFRGRGLQLHPLASFKKANNMHGACVKRSAAPCRRSGLARLLNEISALAVRRSRGFIAWEYLFHFGGGAPPWMSGMAQASALQALARGAQLLGRPGYVSLGRRALGAFEAGPPVGVRARGPLGGVHYLQYSFAPRLFIYNSFFHAVLGLWDFDQLAGDGRARRLYEDAEPEARREVPTSDTGSWSRYSYRGRRSTGEYHELLREILQGMCDRRLGEVYCTYAARYRRYQQAARR